MLLSHTQGSTDLPLVDETIGAHLARIVERFADREALVVRHERYRASYRQLWEQVDATARGLIARGVQKGDRVGIWSPNRHEWVLVQYATARIGAILVNINPAYQPDELRYALEKSGVGLLVMATAMGERPAGVETVVLEEDWAALLAGGAQVGDAELAAREASLDPDDPINIQFTSGTTGSPKGATLTHRNLLNNARFTGHVMAYTEADRMCVPVPFYHCSGMVVGTLCCATHGACVVVPSAKFDAEAMLEAVEAERCTSMMAVPTMYIAALAHPRFEQFDLRSLRTGAIGGAPCPVDVMRRIREDMHMAGVTIVYGMTETSPLSTQTALDDPVEKRIETVGRVHPHVEVKIVDPRTGETVPRGVPGEHCTRGYSVMLGYWNDPEATAAAIDADGWMHTGDLATMDDDGYIRIVGRIKDMIIRGGENIYPREIEEFLHTLADVAEAHVVGVPSAYYGEEVMAWVKLRDGARLTPEDLAAACTGRIARFKIPRHWRVVESFPMTVTGKVQKYRLRELAAAA
jgi:fatty-acyl-CoA synthase